MSGDNISLRQSNLPGERLKYAREQLGWSVHETAEMLHVIPRYVTAIENSEYSQLPGLVFLKGYMRSYARIVDIAEDQLIADLEQDLLLKDDPILKQVAASAGPFADEEFKSRKPFWYALLFLVVAGLGYAGWSSYEHIFGQQPADSKVDAERIDTPSTAGTVSQQPGGAQADNLAGNGLADTDSDSYIDPETGEIKLRISLPENGNNIAVDANKGLSGSNSAADNNGRLSPSMPAMQTSGALHEAGDEEIISGQAGVGLAVERQALSANNMENGSLNTDLTASGLAEDVAMANPVITESGIAIGSVNVSASFNGDCWFDLRDRNNDRIVGLYRSGDSVNFSGEYPLKFVVGAVNAVTIRVNNKSLDFADYPVKNNRAQFTLER